MGIYTKTGDGGWTNWPNGRRLCKSDARVGAIGALDELNATIGWCIEAVGRNGCAEIQEALVPLQPELLAAGAMLVAEWTQSEPQVKLTETAVTRIEGQIEAVSSCVGQLDCFILPGGCELACRLHIARGVSRRAEAAVIIAKQEGAEAPATILKYLNRFSDLLFALARKANHDAGTAERLWRQ